MTHARAIVLCFLVTKESLQKLFSAFLNRMTLNLSGEPIRHIIQLSEANSPRMDLLEGQGIDFT
jgi:hypothetical protein